MLGHTGPQFIILICFYTTYIITVKSLYHMPATNNENKGYKLRLCVKSHYAQNALLIYPASVKRGQLRSR